VGSSLGFYHSKESKVLMSEAHKGKILSAKTKMSKNNARPWLDKTHTEETIAKMSLVQSSIDRTGKNNPMFGKLVKIIICMVKLILLKLKP